MNPIESNQYLTVTAINRYLKAKFEQDKYLRKIYIKGEISNLKKHYTGHYYFTLKDENSKISAIMFNSYVKNLAFDVEEGMQVLITGSISVYENGGSYTLQAYSMEMDGIGNLYLMIEKTKKKLFEEGLFNDQHKKPIPKYPNDIGVLAANNSAALKDIINTINRRYPIARLHIFHVPVQGKDAYKQIIQRLQEADDMKLDVILLARGGGSLEDLMNFNEEQLVRCIYDLNTPVITGVGHEVDYTLVDYVADLRAPTPTGAAMLCCVDLKDLTQYLMMNEQQLVDNIYGRITYYQEKLQQYDQIKLLLVNQLHQIQAKSNSLNQKIHYLSKSMIVNKQNEIHIQNIKIQTMILDQLKYQRIHFNKLLDELTILSPLNTLKRGYSIISSDHTITSIYDLKEDQTIKIQMHDGIAHAKLKEIDYE